MPCVFTISGHIVAACASTKVTENFLEHQPKNNIKSNLLLL